MDNKENENASVPENNTGKSSKKLSKKENRIITVIMFGVIAPLLLIGKTGADWDSAPEQTGTLLMRQS